MLSLCGVCYHSALHCVPFLPTQAMSVDQKKYETVRHALFFKEDKCKQLYKDNVDFITSRKNSISGVVYKNDPTILAWNLVNEPRCETWMPENSFCPAALSSWFQVNNTAQNRVCMCLS